MLHERPLVRACVWPCSESVGERGGGTRQVTETVGPSVVRSQKSSDRLSSVEWSVRERRERTSCFCPCVGGVGHTLDLPPRGDFTETVCTVGAACVSHTVIPQGICFMIKISLSLFFFFHPFFLYHNFKVFYFKIVCNVLLDFSFFYY